LRISGFSNDPKTIVAAKHLRERFAHEWQELIHDGYMNYQLFSFLGEWFVAAE
jgi:hypothetical protein